MTIEIVVYVLCDCADSRDRPVVTIFTCAVLEQCLFVLSLLFSRVRWGREAIVGKTAFISSHMTNSFWFLLNNYLPNYLNKDRGVGHSLESEQNFRGYKDMT